MAQNFLSCDREQDFLMPPSVREWLPAGHLAWYLLDVVERLDLDGFYGAYRADGSGRPAHDPAMMVALLLYAYCVGERSSRRIERRCVEDVAFRVIAANRAPDHTTISRFRKRHGERLAELFVQVLRMCEKAGLVRRAEHRERTGRNPTGRPPGDGPGAQPPAEAKRNLTDPDSRIMRDRGGPVQAYNAQALVGENRVIIAADVTTSPNDSHQLLPMLAAARENLRAIGHEQKIRCVLADGGYWNHDDIATAGQSTVVVIPTHDPHHTRRKQRPRQGPEADRINTILATRAGKRLYRRRAELVEPVFAHTQHTRGITRFSRRGHQAARAEWRLIAATHNLLKLFRYQPQRA